MRNLHGRRSSIDGLVIASTKIHLECKCCGRPLISVYEHNGEHQVIEVHPCNICEDAAMDMGRNEVTAIHKTEMKEAYKKSYDQGYDQGEAIGYENGFNEGQGSDE